MFFTHIITSQIAKFLADLGIFKDGNRTSHLSEHGVHKFKYPLFKMWEQRLLKHKVLTTVEEVRQQLDGHGVDSVSCLLLYGFFCLLFT